MKYRIGAFFIAAQLGTFQVQGEEIGLEPFSYPDGVLAGQAGGDGFDYDPAAGGHTGDQSQWGLRWGDAAIEGGTLATADAGVFRAFVNPAGNAARGILSAANENAVYIKVTLNREPGALWSGVSIFEAATMEHTFFGVSAGPGPSGQQEFMIEPKSGQAAGFQWTGIVAQNSQNHTMVLKIDLTLNIVSLWVDPNLETGEAGLPPAATMPWNDGEGVNGLLIQSGGAGTKVNWDDLTVANTWTDLCPIPATAPDAIKMHLGQTVRLNLTDNDGDVNVDSVELDTPPMFGAVSIDGAGFVTYQNTGGSSPGSDVFSYTVRSNCGRLSNPTDVTVDLTPDPKLALTTSRMATTRNFGIVDAFPGITWENGFAEPCAPAHVPGSSQALVVGTRLGQIHLISDVSQEPPPTGLFLDLAALLINRGEALHIDGESGLKSIAFHPNYDSNRRFFVNYCVTKGGENFVRLSRFLRAQGAAHVADPDSEVILFELKNEGIIHNIDDLRFGPDGNLFVSLGDEGGQGDPFDNSQKIEKDLWSGILRIDVDNKQGSLAPTPHPAIPTDNGVARFKIPADNPWIGATHFNGIPVDPSKLRTEFWAVGFRNPWQICFDEQTNEWFASDVGGGGDLGREEVNRAAAGGNFGWAIQEGEGLNPNYVNPPAGWDGGIEPIHQYLHEDDRGRAVVAGLVYRGSAYEADFQGKLFFADYITGDIRFLSPDDPDDVTRLGGVPFPVAFELDPVTDEILIVSITGKIYRVRENAGDDGIPATLSETGLFSNLDQLSPNPGLIPYDVNLPFWSDNAIKRRFFGVPSEIATFGFHDEGSWDVPEGSIFVKHFELELERGNPSTKKRIETRLIVRTASAAYGVSYRWREDQTEADLVPDEGDRFDIGVIDNGAMINQSWEIPSRTQCAICHTEAAGHVLSFESRQLNRQGHLAEDAGNFISLLVSAGYLAGLGGTDPNVEPKHVAPGDLNFPIEERVRSWLGVNCSYCHRQGGNALPAEFDARTHLGLNLTGLIDGMLVGGAMTQEERLIVSGDAPNSVVLSRMGAANNWSRMPPLASSIPDDSAIQLLRTWIENGLREYGFTVRELTGPEVLMGANQVFPSTGYMGGVSERIFLVTNISSREFQMLPAEIEIPSPFEFVSFSDSILSPGETSILRIRFSPSSAGSFMTDVRLRTAGTELVAPFEFTVSGPAAPGSGGTIQRLLEEISVTRAGHIEKIVVSWNAAAANFNIYRATVNDYSSSVHLGLFPGTVFEDLSVQPGLTYFYWVQNEDAVGVSPIGVSGVPGSLAEAKPDLVIGKIPREKRGNDIYNVTGAGQRISETASGRRRVKSFSQLQNDSSAADSINLSGARGTRKWRVKYMRTSRIAANISGAVKLGTYASDVLLPGSRELIRVEVKPLQKLKQPSRRYRLRMIARSILDGTRSDVIEVRTVQKP